MPNRDPSDNPFRSMPEPEPLPVATMVVAEPKRENLPRPKPRLARLGFFDPFLEAKDFFGSDYWLFWGLIFVGVLIAGIVPLILIGPMYCGTGWCFLAKERGQRPTFELMFKGFDQFANTLVPVLLYSLIALVVVPFYIGGLWLGAVCTILGLTSLNVLLVLLGLCLLAVGIGAMLLVSTIAGYGVIFSAFLVAEYNLQGMDAFQISFEGIKKNFLGLLGSSFAGMILSTAGILLCYIPFILMLPLFMGSTFVCYRKIFRAPPRQPMSRVNPAAPAPF